MDKIVAFSNTTGKNSFLCRRERQIYKSPTKWKSLSRLGVIRKK